MIKILKLIFKKILSPRQIQIIKKLKIWFDYNIITRLYSKDLIKLATIYGTDKWGTHFYASHYTKHFNKLRNKKLKILEIGVGGYTNTKKGGESLRMWKRYFPKSMIYSIDIYDKSILQEKRIKIFQGSQADKVFLKDIYNQIGSLDIIIDDGSHIADHVLTSFKTLFPLLKEGGIYVVEDIQTSYWPSFTENSDNLNDSSTPMNFFKTLTDGLNYQEFLIPNYTPSYFYLNIIAIHFYHNLVLIYKGKNNEPSNAIKNGRFKV